MNVSIEVHTGHLNISPELFRMWAQQYLQARRSIVIDAQFTPVPYFLLCMAIELQLKSHHLETLTRDQVKGQYGHRLKRSYDQLPAPLQPLDAVEYQALVQADRIYNDEKGFEYVSVYDAVTALRDFPDLAALDQVAAKLIGI